MREISTIGFIGLGVMGKPLCANLAKNTGLPVIAYDTDPAPLKRLAADGVSSLGSVAQIGATADLIFLSLPDGEALREVCDELSESIQEGAIIVDTSTAPVRLTREMAMRFEFQNSYFADAPVARTRAAAREGTLSVMVGGDEKVFKIIEPFIECFAGEITHCGDVGSGQIVKLMNNMVLVETVTALAEAMAIGRRAGVDADVLFDTLAKGSADSYALRNHAMKSMKPGVFPKKAFPVTYMLKDLKYALQLAQDTGVVAKGADYATDLLLVAVEREMGEAYFPIISAVLDIDIDYETPEGDE